jgi:hypothetical protein
MGLASAGDHQNDDRPITVMAWSLLVVTRIAPPQNRGFRRIAWMRETVAFFAASAVKSFFWLRLLPRWLFV